MAIRNLATVAGRYKCNRYSGRLGGSSYDGFRSSSFSEMLDGVEAFI